MPDPSQDRTSRLPRAEVVVCLLAATLALVLHTVCLTHAGPLWRDEATSVRIASLPTLGQAWQMLPHDSAPALYSTLLRLWSGLGLGRSDFALRVFGFLIGLGLLGALWLHAWLTGRRLPLVSLGLLAASPALVHWGDSLRPYGCGCVLIVLTLALIWRLVQAPGRVSFALAALAAILCAQALYQNAVLLLAACAGAWAVCLRRRQRQPAMLVLAVGLLAALSLVPYLPSIIRSQDAWIVQKTGLRFESVWRDLLSSFGASLAWPVWVWLALVALAFGAVVLTLQEKPESKSIGADDLALFGTVALLSGIVGIFVFLHLAGLASRPWYFLALMTFCAAAIDDALLVWSRRFRFWPLAFCAVMVGLLFPTALREARLRQTNVDLIAAALEKRAKPGDLIVVFPWHAGVSFERYYKGKVPWTTLPPLSDHLHRYDLLKQQLHAQSPVKPLLAQAAATLASGHSVWITGTLPGNWPGRVDPPPDLPPAPLPHLPWPNHERLYIYTWARQLTFLATSQARRVEPIPVNASGPVNFLENLPLTMFSGTRMR